MRQIVFASGKGGTGKSTLVASLSRLIGTALYADCDVEGSNLHLLLKGSEIWRKPFQGAETALIDRAKCLDCGVCATVCRFGALRKDAAGSMGIRAYACEGCGACVPACPAGAISIVPVLTAQSVGTRSQYGLLSRAEAVPGAEGSGKCVTEVRKRAVKALDGEEWLLIDGAPGIGCVVIASITGADALVAVTEPTPSGEADLKRLIALARRFSVPAFVCVNKWDLNPEKTEQIERSAEHHGARLLGRIAFDPDVLSALRKGMTPVEAGIKGYTEAIHGIWQQMLRLLDTGKGGE